jgi:hypothetical protein
VAEAAGKQNCWLRRVKLSKKFAAVALLIILPLLAGCANADDKPVSTVDNETQLLAEVREIIRVIQTVSDDPSPFKKVMVDPALGLFEKEHRDMLKEGRIKMRSYKDVELKIADMSNGTARVEFDFTDESYEADKDSLTPLTQPTGEEQHLVLHVKKEAGRWKLNSAGAKEEIKS